MALIVNPLEYGIDFQKEFVTVVIRGGAVSKGDLLALCISNGDDEITGDSLTPTTTPGLRNSIFGSATKVYDDATTQYGWFGVAMDNYADQQLGVVQIRGIVEDAYCMRYHGGTLSIGLGGVPGTTSTNQPTSNGATAYPNAVASTVGRIDFCYTGSTIAVTSTYSPKIVAINLTSRAAGTSTSTPVLNRVLFDGINGFGSINTL